MIRSFKCKETQRIFDGKVSGKLPSDIQRAALRKLLIINSAERLDDLKVPPANRLEALKGKRLRQHSIRVNDKWRTCFVWQKGDVYDVEIVDYH